MTTELATTQPAGVIAAPESVQFNPAERAMLAQLGLSDAPEGDLMLFAHVCRTSGLDPFRREIYMIGRNTQVTKYVPNARGDGQHKETRYETVYTIQTGIQGFRKRARELADAKGDRLGFEGPFWAGEDGVWREMWPQKTPVPVAAKYVVFRNGEPCPAVCHYDEYVQEAGSGADRGPNSMWSKMPRNQLAKCAEAQALQRAYPDELSGLILEDAASDAVTIDETGLPQQPLKRRAGDRGRGVDSLRDRAAAASTGDDDRPAAADEPTALIEEINAILHEADCDAPGDRFIIFADILGDEYDDRAQLTEPQLKRILTALASTPLLADKIRDVLNAATLKQESAAEQAGEQQTLDGTEGAAR